MQLKKQKTWVPLEETPTGVSPGADCEHREQELAATKIQSRVRGKQARRGVVETNFPNHWSRMRQAWSSPIPTPCRSFAVVLLCDVSSV